MGACLASEAKESAFVTPCQPLPTAGGGRGSWRRKSSRCYHPRPRRGEQALILLRLCYRERHQQFSSIQSLSRVRLFVTPWTAACQASLSISNSQSLLKLMSIESMMPSNQLILCRPLLFLPSIFPSIRVFSNDSVLSIRWPKYWNFSFILPSIASFIHLFTKAYRIFNSFNCQS